MVSKEALPGRSRWDAGWEEEEPTSTEEEEQVCCVSARLRSCVTAEGLTQVVSFPPPSCVVITNPAPVITPALDL